MRHAPDEPGIERIDAYFAGYAYDPHRHDTYALGYTLTGLQCFDYRGAVRASRPGNVIVLHPDERHNGRAGEESGFRYRMIYLEPRLIAAALGTRAAALPFVSEVVSTDAYLLRALTAALDDLERPFEALERDQIVLAIAEALLARDPSARRGAFAATSAVAVERTRQFLDAHFDRTVASEELEAATGLDRYALARHFRARLGTSPYRYLTMRRLDHARGEIRAGASLADAAFASGFADQSHMTRHFKRAYGLSPGKWRSLLAVPPDPSLKQSPIRSSPRAEELPRGDYPRSVIS
jgi:AraC-like DNA-binding protein